MGESRHRAAQYSHPTPIMVALLILVLLFGQIWYVCDAGYPPARRDRFDRAKHRMEGLFTSPYVRRGTCIGGRAAAFASTNQDAVPADRRTA